MTYFSDISDVASHNAGQLDPLRALLLRHAEIDPGRLAIKADDDVLTYGQLLDRVRRVAGGMRDRGLEGSSRVVIAQPNSAAFVVTALAAMWVGAAFVPVGVEEASGRLHQILRDCEASLIVAPQNEIDTMAAFSPAITLDELSSGHPAGAVPASGVDRDAYMIYTSGTSGAPKGVRISVGAFLASISATTEVLGLDASTRSLCVSTFQFDGSYATLFPTLLAGGGLVIPRRRDLVFLKRFFRSVRDDGITHTSFSPSYLRLLLQAPQLKELAGSRLRSLGLGGEEPSAEDLRRLWNVLPELAIYNYYGPTETTIEVTTHRITPDSLDSGRVPLGLPHRGVTFHLLTDHGAIIDTPGQSGELCIGGAQLMSGYWHDEVLTSRVLRDDLVPGQTVYRTGDLACFDAQGTYFYMGRRDDVIKRSGVRVSLVEVSRALMSLQGVDAALATTVPGPAGVRIVAFIQAESGRDESSALADLAHHLPSNMHPDRVFCVERFPLTPRGKVDREALLAAHLTWL